MASYICPHCGADDSTRCDKLPPAGVKPYSEKQMDEARAVGCRVAHYVDERVTRAASARG